MDLKGLVAVWREGLLARAVLRDATRAYRRHPQLARFRDSPTPMSAINSYLREVAEEADRRGYRFDKSKTGPVRRRVRQLISSVFPKAVSFAHVPRSSSEAVRSGLGRKE